MRKNSSYNKRLPAGVCLRAELEFCYELTLKPSQYTPKLGYTTRLFFEPVFEDYFTKCL